MLELMFADARVVRYWPDGRAALGVVGGKADLEIQRALRQLDLREEPRFIAVGARPAVRDEDLEIVASQRLEGRRLVEQARGESPPPGKLHQAKPAGLLGRTGTGGKDALEACEAGNLSPKSLRQ